MSAFWIEGTSPLIPTENNIIPENEDFPAPHFPEVIAQVKGEVYYPQTICSWGNRALGVWNTGFLILWPLDKAKSL